MIGNRLKRCFRYTLCMALCLASVEAGAQRVKALYASNDVGIVYTSLERALQDTGKVYRLRLKSLPVKDSLPEQLFQLTELRELTVKGCRLCSVSKRIGELTKLQYLNLDRNKLVRLPESIGNLRDLKTLIISRNKIEMLPDAIGKIDSLTLIDAWNNPMYVLPDSISAISNTLKTLDLRQIPLRKAELEAMEKLLPKTKILFTDICECENRRDHD